MTKISQYQVKILRLKYFRRCKQHPPIFRFFLFARNATMSLHSSSKYCVNCLLITQLSSVCTCPNP